MNVQFLNVYVCEGNLIISFCLDCALFLKGYILMGMQKCSEKTASDLTILSIIIIIIIVSHI